MPSFSKRAKLRAVGGFDEDIHIAVSQRKSAEDELNNFERFIKQATEAISCALLQPLRMQAKLRAVLRGGEASGGFEYGGKLLPIAAKACSGDWVWF